MNVGSSLIANPQSAELVQPSQSSLHHPPVDAQAAPVLGQPLGQDWPDPQPTQSPAVGFRVIGSVSLNLIRPPAGTSPLPPKRRNGLHQGEQLGHVMSVRSGENSRQGNPLGIGNDMMLATQLASVGGIGSGFSPRRPRLGRKRYPPRLGTSQSGRLLAVGPVTIHGASARPQLPASRADGANRSCPSHSPFPGAASPKGCHSSGQTGCQ